MVTSAIVAIVEPITFPTEDGLELEGEIHRPAGEPRAAAVICHPHPLHGGSKDHPLLWAIRIDLTRGGLVVLAFNFRGVMGSAGRFGEGIDEVADVRAAIGRASEEMPAPMFVAGWSFGANVALREAVDDDRIRALALVGMPLDESSLLLPDLPSDERLAAFQTPVLLVAGDADPFCPASALRDLGARLPRSRVVIVANADHYFARREREPAGLVGGFAQEALALT